MSATSREPLNRTRILEAALRLVDAEGLARLSMRRLGQELGVEAMSLYHHVPSKAALLNGIVELLLSRIEAPSPQVGDWQYRIRALAHAYRRVAHNHPHAFPLIVTTQFSTPDVQRLVDAVIEIYRDSGFGEAEAVDAFCTLTGYVTGAALFEIGGFLSLAIGAPPRLGTTDDSNPALSPADDDPGGSSREFEFGLDVVLTGLAAMACHANARSGACVQRLPPDDRS